MIRGNLTARTGFTLFETTLALGLATMLLTSVFGLLRFSHHTWKQIDSADTYVQAVKRSWLNELKQCHSLLSIRDNRITCLQYDGSQVRWEIIRNSIWKFENGKRTLYAQEIVPVKFIGFQANGRTSTNQANLVRMVQLDFAEGIDCWFRVGYLDTKLEAT